VGRLGPEDRGESQGEEESGERPTKTHGYLQQPDDITLDPDEK
jgi:hypothetical protein